MFAKLPSAFKIDTPLGGYNPDWAYVEEADGERRVYFVTETKGGKNGEPALRDAEEGFEDRLRQEALRGAGPRKRLPLQRAHDLPIRGGEGQDVEATRKDDAKAALGAAVLPAPFRGFLRAASCLTADRRAPSSARIARTFAACAIFMRSSMPMRQAMRQTDSMRRTSSRLSYLSSRAASRRFTIAFWNTRGKRTSLKTKGILMGKPPLRAGGEYHRPAPYQYARRQEMVTRDSRRAAQKRSSDTL